jgi:TRAP-type C4-dicarboxylate transport system permease small subunit
MATIWRWLEGSGRIVSLLALAGLVILPATQVVLRTIFSSPITGLEEATRYGLIILVFLAVPSLIAGNEHIRLAEFIAYLPRAMRILLERITLLIGAACFGIIAYAGMSSALRNASTRTPTLDIPFWLFILPMVLGFAIATLGYLWFALRREPPRTQDATPTI